MFLFLFILSLFCSGCATLYLQVEGIPESFSSKEIGKKAAILDSKYCGQETINEKEYHRYIIKGTRAACKYDSTIDMLLSIDAGKKSEVIFREANLKKTCKEQPAQVYYMFIPAKNDLETDSVNYPKKIFILPPGQFGSDEMKVSYQDTSKDQTARFVDASVDSSDLKWICRDKGKYAAYCALTPFAVVFDALTWPLQLIIFAFSY